MNLLDQFIVGSCWLIYLPLYVVGYRSYARIRGLKGVYRRMIERWREEARVERIKRKFEEHWGSAMKYGRPILLPPGSKVTAL